MKPTITEDIANRIYDILIEECGASEHQYDREAFIRSEARGTTEYRFMGDLGMGGKFWNCNDKFYVSCYPEDETPQTRRAIKSANEKLAAIYSEVVALEEQA